MISKNDLDKRICDLEGSSNEQTYREYIRETEEEFGIGEMRNGIVNVKNLFIDLKQLIYYTFTAPPQLFSISCYN